MTVTTTAATPTTNGQAPATAAQPTLDQSITNFAVSLMRETRNQEQADSQKLEEQRQQRKQDSGQS